MKDGPSKTFDSIGKIMWCMSWPQFQHSPLATPPPRRKRRGRRYRLRQNAQYQDLDFPLILSATG